MPKRLVSAIYSDFYPFDKLSFVEGTLATSDPDELNKDDILVVWGGADISPALYNKRLSKRTWADPYPSMRDRIEWALMQRAKDLNIPIIGVCRGAQMLCALAGGYLIQHVNHHAGAPHIVLTIDGEEIQTNSIHHQMMYPFNVPHEMLGRTKEKLSDKYYDVNDLVEVPHEPEYVYFPEVKGFAVQWHPEMMRFPCPATEYVFKTIEEKLNVNNSKD